MVFLETLSDYLLNIGFTLPDFILFTILLCSMVIFALDLRIGLMFLNISLAFGLIFVTIIGLETGVILVTFFISIVLTTLSLYFINRKGVV